MCWWCGNPACDEGSICDFDYAMNPLLNSNTFWNTVQRIENAIGREITYAPGKPWDGLRPSFISGVRDAVMGGPTGTGGMICPLCGVAINGTNGQADHRIPWEDYIRQSARAAMREHNQNWAGGSIPDDFARVMSSDPDNLQATHARCNGHKSNSMPGQSAGDVRKANQEARARMAARQKEAERKKREQQRRDKEEWYERWTHRHDDPDSDQDPDGAGILV